MTPRSRFDGDASASTATVWMWMCWRVVAKLTVVRRVRSASTQVYHVSDQVRRDLGNV
jgi:hypothetical protein